MYWDLWKIIEICQQYQIQNGCDSEGFIFSNDGEPCGYTPTRELYDKYCKKLGIIKKSSHKARKTYISSLLDGNVNVNSVREMAGHRDERTTLSNYYFDRSSDEEKKKMIEAALAI